MPRTLTLTLSDEEFEVLAREATRQKKSPEQLALEVANPTNTSLQMTARDLPPRLECLETTISGTTPVQPPKTAGSLKDFFGSVSLGHPTGADNESIDRDLMLAYADNHEID